MIYMPLDTAKDPLRVVYKGQEYDLNILIDRLGIDATHRPTIRYRIKKWGSVERALHTPIRKYGKKIDTFEQYSLKYWE